MGQLQRRSTLEHSRQDSSCIRTKYMGQLNKDTVDGRLTLGHSRWYKKLNDILGKAIKID